MDKNDHLHNLLGGHSERIGDWTPAQLAAFIQDQSNDPTQMPHAFTAKSINLTEHLVVGGKQFEHAVIPRAVTMGDAKGKTVGIYPQHSGSRALNGAYAAINPTANKVFAETYDQRLTTADVALVSGTMRAQAFYVPHKERLSGMYLNYSQFETGGTFTYGGYAIYGPIAYDASVPGLNSAQLPQIAITQTANINNFRAASPYFIQNGYLGITGATPWDLVIESGIYFMAALYSFSVAPTANARLISDAPVGAALATFELGIPGFMEAFTIAKATLPATLDITAGGNAFSNARIWAAFYNDNAKQI